MKLLEQFSRRSSGCSKETPAWADGRAPSTGGAKVTTRAEIRLVQASARPNLSSTRPLRSRSLIDLREPSEAEPSGAFAAKLEFSPR